MTTTGRKRLIGMEKALNACSEDEKRGIVVVLQTDLEAAEMFAGDNNPASDFINEVILLVASHPTNKEA